MQVPTDFVQDVMPQGLQGYNSIDRATPENFGGQVGQSLDQAGNMLQQNALQRQQLANETNVNDVYANQFSPAARDIYQNYMKLEGKDAEARFPEFQQQMNDLRTQVRAGLPNTMQQKAFDEASTRRVEMDLDGMARYAAAQTRAWEWNTHTAVMADLTNEAEANWNNPQRLQNVRDRIDDETADYGMKHGWSSEVFRYQLGENNDKLWSAVIKRQALSGDFTGAMKTYRDQVSAGRISGSAQGDLEKFFKPIQDLQSAQNAYGKVTGGAMAQQIAGEAQRQGVDPGTALTIWSAEGGVTNPATKNRSSSATGIFQHLDSTWADQGGTDQDRFDSNRQVQLGVALAKQNTAALAKDLGRQPQPWEVYLAHQQGLSGATALLHADPNASAAGALGGGTDKLTLNGIPADATAGQALGYIKNYVDKHAQMYEPNGVPSAQNIAGNYSAQLQGVADQAQRDFPGDPGMQQLYVNHYQQQAGQAIRAQQMTDRANNSVVFNALTGPNPVSSWPEFNSDPQRKAAFDALYKTDASIHDRVDRAINVNAWKAWDPPATQETSNLYNQLNGMSATDREAFSKLNLMQYYGAMPVSQFNDLADTQKKIHAGDAAQAAKSIDLQASLSAVKDLAKMAFADPGSPLYQVMPEPTSLPDQQKWNGFVSKFGQALEDWRQNNNGKIPTDMQKRQIAQGILFPQPPGQQPSPAGSPAEIATLRDRDASPVRSSDSSEFGAIIIPPAQDANTSKDADADTNVVDSNSKPDQMVSEQDAVKKGDAAPGTSQENKGPTAPRVDILVIPRSDKGYDFVAMDNGDNPKAVRGQFNVTTTNDTGKVRPGEYTLSFRPHIDEKSGIAGIKQEIGAMLSGNFSLDVNKHKGNPTLSNTDDWNTIRYKDGTVLGGVMIHPGLDKATGQGGATWGCFVTDKPTYEQLNQMLLENSNNDGNAYFHLLPRKVSQ